MSRDPLAPRYRTGDDLALCAGAVRFEFSREDFAARVVAAAARLGLVDAHAVGDADRDDLVAIAVRGAREAARDGGELAEHLGAHRHRLVHEGRDLVHWLRRLVMREAWIDRHVADGHLEPVFVPGRGFAYRAAATGAPAAEDPGAPDWSAYLYRRTAA